jgi:hypothetical protein
MSLATPHENPRQGDRSPARKRASQRIVIALLGIIIDQCTNALENPK